MKCGEAVEGQDVTVHPALQSSQDRETSQKRGRPCLSWITGHNFETNVSWTCILIFENEFQIQKVTKMIFHLNIPSRGRKSRSDRDYLNLWVRNKQSFFNTLYTIEFNFIKILVLLPIISSKYNSNMPF